MKNLNDLIALSRRFGADPGFVLAGGGNTSRKDGRTLHVKASGSALETIGPEGFVAMDRRALARVWEKPYPASAREREAAVLADLLAARRPGEEGKRPSVETLLHDLFSRKLVVHTHPALVNGLACSIRAKDETRRLFGNKALFVPYVDPGLTLARVVRSLIQERRNATGREPQILILQNHGLFVAADTEPEILRLTRLVISTLDKRVKARPDFTAAEGTHERAALLAPVLRALSREGENLPCVTFLHNREIARVAADRASFSAVASAFTPDHIVYSGPAPLYIPCHPTFEKQEALLATGLAAYRKRFNRLPRVVVVQKTGVFGIHSSKAAADISLLLFQDAVKISVYARAFGGGCFMAPARIAFILNWEAESYRKKVSVAACGPGRMAGKAAVVTGGAQGFGRGIAEGLLAEGATVVIADIREEDGRRSALELEGKYGKGRAAFFRTDVSDEASVAALMRESALCFGGIDILVSNAGILRAGPIAEMTLRDFERVTRINYTAFFLCVKSVAPYMLAQNRRNPGGFTDIIQINSKSGLSGSKANFAYAGSKFGGLGLTQSFALELAQDRIKVNAVCPGNLFDGPLWSDPKNGLFVQYLNAKKVPGARTIGDVKRYYESRVPMGRGCELPDVVRAVLYLVEQRYETGQALPVTGGQNMLK